MKACTFFGHRDTVEQIYPLLRKTLVEIIEKDSVDTFLVGDEGNFDRMVQRVLKELQADYSGLVFSIVLAYLPTEENVVGNTMMFPDFESVPKRFAIDRRNHYLLNSADIVVAYVRGVTGGAYKFFEKAKRQGKKVINIADIEKPPLV